MSFSSINFIVILPLLLLFYWNLPDKYKRVWLLISSIIVYMAAGWQDLLLLFSVTSINWLSSKLYPNSKRTPIVMIIFNVLCLAWFKYRIFLGGLVGIRSIQGLVIPLGISFYVFQLISYQVELHKKIITKIQPYFVFFLYIFFFPHHQAGPIMRPHAFLGTFLKGRSWVTGRFKIGVLIFLWGLFKKIWIADWLMGNVVRYEFQQLHMSNGLQGNALFLAVIYGILIYADFSGYSDIAVGLGRMFGFKLDRNFHQPYIAFGPSEFWRRWHVTLSRWLRDHIYIPLGGNRLGSVRTQVNLLAVMVIGGMWHGSGWCFLLWGLLHGLYLILERLTDPVMKKVPYIKLGVFQILFMLAWIPFRETDLSVVWTLFSRASAWTGQYTFMATLLLIGIIAFSLMENWIEQRFTHIIRWLGNRQEYAFAMAYSGILFAILTGVRHETMFIYQRF